MTQQQMQRLDFIDALRGIAALAVLLQHCAEKLWPAYYRFSVETIRPGQWGVFVFFLVSGFVIPLSLKRETSTVAFWIGRFFRLFPLYWAMLAAAYVTWQLGWYGVDPAVSAKPLWHLIKNATMVQEFIDADHYIGAAWSLAYEMVFYLYITVIFMSGLTKKAATKSTIATLGLAISLGLLITPTFVLGAEPHTKRIAIPLAVTALFLTIFWDKLSNKYHKAASGFTLFIGVALLLNQPLDMWFTLLLFATMGCGWVYYEAHCGRARISTALLLSVATTFLFALQLRWWTVPHLDPQGAFVTWKASAVTLFFAHATFIATYFLRSYNYPKTLLWLGKISYSSYLVHAIVINAVPKQASALTTLTVWVAITLVISTATFYGIELPMQKVGRRLRTRWRTSRLGVSEIDLRTAAKEVRTTT